MRKVMFSLCFSVHRGGGWHDTLLLVFLLQLCRTTVLFTQIFEVQIILLYNHTRRTNQDITLHGASLCGASPPPVRRVSGESHCIGIPPDGTPPYGTPTLWTDWQTGILRIAVGYNIWCQCEWTCTVLPWWNCPPLKRWSRTAHRSVSALWTSLWRCLRTTQTSSSTCVSRLHLQPCSPGVAKPSLFLQLQILLFHNYNACHV